MIIHLNVQKITYIDFIYKKGHVAVDTETTSLDTYAAKLVGISLCVDDKVAYIHTNRALQNICEANIEF